jgi:hypothetical protein
MGHDAYIVLPHLPFEVAPYEEDDIALLFDPFDKKLFHESP